MSCPIYPEIWTAHIGAEGPLTLALEISGELIDVSELTTSTLNFRLRTDPAGTVHTATVTAFVDPNGVYNAQVTFTDYTGITPGVYLANVVASLAGAPFYFPSDGYFLLRFLAPVEPVVP